MAKPAARRSIRRGLTQLLTLFGTALGLLAFAGPAAGAVFAGTGTGGIPDSPVGGPNCPDPGAPRDVTFAVAGVIGPVGDVRVDATFAHSWVGDLEVTLIAPGGAPSQKLFSKTGGVTASACGSSSNTTGPYSFFDGAPAAPTWWAAAAAATNTTSVASGSYRASTPGGAAGSGANTVLAPTFAGLPNANGVWTLRFVDNGEDDLGAVTAATLTLNVDLTPPAAPTLTSTDPASPADNNSPRVKGGAETGSQVKLYAGADCSGSPVATSSAADLGSPGFAGSVADNSTTDFRATATDASNNVSSCSAAITYQEVTPSGDPGPVDPPVARCGGKDATITGTADVDLITGTDGADVIAALGGNDKANGGKGNDVICGGRGNDRLNGGSGRDKLFGDAGKDKLDGSGGKGDSCNGGAGKDKGSACEKGPDS